MCAAPSRPTRASRYVDGSTAKKSLRQLFSRVGKVTLQSQFFLLERVVTFGASHLANFLGEGIPRFLPWLIRGVWTVDSYLVAYDISDPKRLRKVATVCEDFGYRKQLSVFLCRLSATDFVRMRSRLYDAINLDQDQVLFIPLCGKCGNAIESLGRPTEAHNAKDVVIVT